GVERGRAVPAVGGEEVVHELQRAPGAAPGDLLLVLRVAAVAVAIVALVALALLIGPPVIVLIACVLSGFGITHLAAVALTFEERLAFGTVLGGVAFCCVSFVLSLVVHDVTVGTVLASSVASVVAGAVAAWTHRDAVVADWRDMLVRWS